MARRKSTAPAAASTPTTAKPHKRQLSTTVTPASRTSKRLRSSKNNTPTNSKVTPKKSKYFEASDSDAEPSSEEGSESGYEEADASATEASEPPTEMEEEYDSEEDVKPKRKPGRKPAGKGSGGVPVVVERGNSLWREGVKAGLGPGKQVFIEKPKPRGDGGIKYVPDRIHPNTMAFLADLTKNNDREWLKMHDPDYRQSWNDWTSFVESLSTKIAEIDDTVPELPPKDLVFRIYRDIRFSNDPTPYKTHFSAAWSRTGRKGPYACYYVQIQPCGKSFVGSGLWHPEAAPLALVRRNIDRKSHLLKGVLSENRLRKDILNVNSSDEKKAVKAFCASNAENALKTKPKGYEADNPNIDLLKLKNFTIGKRLKDDEVADSNFMEIVARIVSTMAPFVTYLNSVVMPDDDASSSDGDEGDDADQDDE